MNANEVAARPELLGGKSLEQVLGELTWSEAWRVEALRRGRFAGQGWVLREYAPTGKPTGRAIRWHPGGGHHGPDAYWRVTSPELGRSEVIR